jgi:hypothetical protein
MSNDDTKVHETDQHLVMLEREARILCLLRGVDPDGRTAVPHPAGLAVVARRSHWLFAADELLSFRQCLLAMRMSQEQAEAANDPKQGVQPH